ncbi:MAG: hypothetical protein JSU82_12160 [Rhodospirillales bacterium]|nr:MAG: hypothetical protein JSU82_12160 [Rhodospirillales bacterium]
MDRDAIEFADREFLACFLQIQEQPTSGTAFICLMNRKVIDAQIAENGDGIAATLSGGGAKGLRAS